MATVSITNEKEYYTALLDKLVSEANKFGHDSVLWQHYMNEHVEAYCKAKGYTISEMTTHNPPAKLGDQYMIHLK